MINPDNVVRI